MPSQKSSAKDAKKSSSKIVSKKSTTVNNIGKSSERVTNSDLESDAAAEQTKSEKSKKTVVATAKSAKVVSTSESSSSESGSEEESGSEGTSSSGSGSESESDSEDESSSASEEAAVTKEAPRARPSNRPSAPYKPPAGFEMLPANDGNTNAAQMFDPANLAGKQVFYITAPATVDISTIKKISLENINKGKPVLSLNDQDYGLVQEALEDKLHAKLLVPDKSKNGYRIVQRPFDSIVHLQEIVKLPETSATTANVAVDNRATVPKKRPVLEQPKGLKMSFRPAGFGDGEAGTIGDSEDDDSDRGTRNAQPVFRQPMSLDAMDIDEAPPAKKSKSKDKSKDKEKKKKKKKKKHGDAKSSQD